MNAFAFVAFCLFWKKWRARYQDTSVYAIFLGLSTLSFGAMAISTVAADRMALYFLPLQAAVMARLPTLIGGRQWGWPVSLAVIAGMCAVMGVWFTYATHAVCWLPYRNILAGSGF
jgi:hypothetical protein